MRSLRAFAAENGEEIEADSPDGLRDCGTDSVVPGRARERYGRRFRLASVADLPFVIGAADRLTKEAPASGAPERDPAAGKSCR
jgi:hypothetical protein